MPDELIRLGQTFVFGRLCRLWADAIGGILET